MKNNRAEEDKTNHYEEVEPWEAEGEGKRDKLKKEEEENIVKKSKKMETNLDQEF